jgi:hypothetical protein
MLIRFTNIINTLRSNSTRKNAQTITPNITIVSMTPYNIGDLTATKGANKRITIRNFLGIDSRLRRKRQTFRRGHRRNELKNSEKKWNQNVRKK